MVGQRFRSRADVDNLWQTVQPGSFSEKQVQWLMLQLCLVTVEVTEWIECSKLDDLNDPRASPRPSSGAKCETRRTRPGQPMMMKIVLRTMIIFVSKVNSLPVIRLSKTCGVSLSFSWVTFQHGTAHSALP